MPIKLSNANLSSLPPSVRVPTYDRRRLGQRITHIGVGGFHRAHQGVYNDDLFQKNGPSEWGLCGVGLLPVDTRIGEVLRSQDYLYTVVERSASGDKARVIGSIQNFLHAPSDPNAVLEKMASPDTAIVSLTITEGGYYVHQGTGEFDAENPDIQHDLAHPHQPKCAFGYLGEALERRRNRGLRPFTIMSCDNLQGNGEIAKKMLLAFIELRDPKQRNWLEQNGTFPNSMVDRITPATTDEHRALVREQFGIEDGWPVMTESFRQWVIEDDFVEGRPAWEQVGAQFTSDVLPYEKMKLRLLNASHQAICYVGMLQGYEFAHEAMADQRITKLMRLMMDIEVTPLLPEVPGIDLDEYKNTLIERFANPAIRDQLGRLGTEGSARIPKFVLPSVTEQLQRGGPIKLLSLTVASWFRYLSGKDDTGKPMPMNDPMLDQLRDAANAGEKDPRRLLAMRQLFSEELASNQRFVQQLEQALASFYDKGTAATLEEYVG
ncbi:MAG TPA: mannitol dehydrogenase family protein [Chthoniobacterales bacterium]|nr:mannitol dehydrogenase family protein [Chthoniobacterales bacterium]